MNNPVRTEEDPLEPTSVPEIPLRIDVAESDQRTVVMRLHGDLDMRTARLLRDELWPRLAPAGCRVVLDLTGIGFLGSAGLSELMSANETAAANGAALLLVADSRTVLRPLEITGLGPLFATFPSIEAALAAEV